VMLAAGESPESSRDWSGIYMVAAVSALLFAVGLPSVEIAREARMYSMMQAWILAQVIFLMRARRLGDWRTMRADDFLSDRSCKQLYRSAGDRSGGSMADLFAACAFASRRRGAKCGGMADMGRARRRDAIAVAFFLPGCVTESEGVSRGDYDLDQAAGAMGAIGNIRKRTPVAFRFHCLRCSR